MLRAGRAEAGRRLGRQAAAVHGAGRAGAGRPRHEHRRPSGSTSADCPSGCVIDGFPADARPGRRRSTRCCDDAGTPLDAVLELRRADEELVRAAGRPRTAGRRHAGDRSASGCAQYHGSTDAAGRLLPPAGLLRDDRRHRHADEVFERIAGGRSSQISLRRS